MSLPANMYAPGDSWLHRLDPRVKLAFALLASAALLSLGSLPLFLLFLAACHALLLLGAGVPAARLGWAWRLMLPITLMIPILWPIFSTTPGPIWLRLGPLAVTWPDVWQGLAMAARVDALAFAFFAWLFTTSQADMVLGFSRLGLPYEWGLTLAIALRYAPTLYTAFERVMDAQRARGLVIPRANPLRAARAYIPALVPVLIEALRTAENLSRALEARAFGAPGRQRTSRRQLRFTWTDGLALAVMLGVFGGLIAARLLWGLGQGPLL
jgi:energy-coupling factor transport system permease protein